MNKNDNLIYVPISVGELFDKISVLLVKKSKINDEEKVKHIIHEYNLLRPLCEELITNNSKLKNKLSEITSINSNLWDILEKQRVMEKDEKLGKEFIDISISVYVENDKRFQIKREINEITKSEVKEEKYYSTT